MTVPSSELTEPALQASTADLVREVAARIPLPIDALEITALVESFGVTDELARRRYGAAHAFALAEQLLATAQSLWPGGSPGHAGPRGLPPVSVREVLIDYAQGPLACSSALLLLVVIRVYGVLGGWESGQVLAFGLGMTTSMLACSGFVYAMSRRTSICLAMDDRASAGHFLRRTMLVAGVCVTAVAGVSLLITSALGAFGLEQRVTFALAFLGLSAIWILASGLSLLRASGWLSVGLGVGLVAGVAVDRTVAAFSHSDSDLHLRAGTGVGCGLALGIVFWALDRRLDPPGALKQPRRVRLPPRAYLVYEAAPFFAYGALYSLLPFLPHPIGWLGALGAGETRPWAVINIEAGLTLSLPPLILASGVAERTLRTFWAEALSAQSRTPGHAPAQFGRDMRGFYAWHLGRYLVVLAALSGVAFGLFRSAQASGVLSSWLGLDGLERVESLFLISPVSYWLVGCGLFNCMLPLSLARPRLAIHAVAPAVAVTLLAGLPLSLGLHFSYAALALLLGAATFVVASTRSVAHVLESADYYYYSAN